ncbi:MAG: 1-acyl-sn-glycerol-3-phosphate acyltransferase [Actinobacteria bacterium]|jgi:1-acyl-sn-glycerol-3-phosphate acyltransferase|nr:1-acyl-sn-glycerol-3-phosphate acyltransferase [Actinomycetota bacterium]
MLYWLLKLFGIGPLLRLFYSPWAQGIENVPLTGPAIMASNHVSFSDSFFLGVVLKRRITYLAKSDYFTGRGFKGALSRAFFSGVGQVPIDRTGGSASQAALKAGLSVLDKGQLLGIYPEGTRSPDGKLYRGKTGVARLALISKAPVIPVAMVGTFDVQPEGRVIPKIGDVGSIIGKPLDFSRYEGLENDPLVLRAVTDEIMYELMKLGSQEYVDVYAADVKKRLKQESDDLDDEFGLAIGEFEGALS